MLILGAILLSTSLISVYAMRVMKSYEFALLTSILTFLGSTFLSVFWLKESITFMQGVGIVLMLFSGLVTKIRV